MSTPAGWYPDPQNPAAQRYWDGTAWTTHTAPGQTAYAQQQTGYPQQPQPAAPAYGYAPSPVSVHRKFGFGESVRRGFSRWTNYSGRATPGEYWWFYLFGLLVAAVAYIPLVIALIIMAATADKTPVQRVLSNGVTVTTTDLHPTGAGVVAVVIAGIIFFVVALILFFPQLALSIRRLHDTDKSGWWYLIALVPFGGLVLLVFFLLPGTPGPNRWGAPVTE